MNGIEKITQRMEDDAQREINEVLTAARAQADEITRRVLDRTEPGSIILFHNAALHTPEALPGILAALQGEGYQFCTVSELLLEGDYTIDSTGRQHAA